MFHARKRIAFLGTVIFQHSHAQHFLDRLTLGYTWAGGWQQPRLDIASTYIEQLDSNPLGRQRLQKYGFTPARSIADALTLGTGKLAVDGVVVIAEHGDYPNNAKGQKLYPRYRWFKEIVKVFEQSGRSVPVFNDKHLSTDWDECKEMVDDAHRLNFAFLAGSSLPVTRRMPEYDLPHGTPLKETVCMAYGGVDSYDFHALETAQCLSERRRGGETGIRNCLALKGDALWSYLSSPDREPTRRLMVAALSRSHNLPVDGGYMTGPVDFAWLRKTMPSTIGYFYDHNDGHRTSSFLAPIQDFNVAVLRGDGRIESTQMYLPMPTHGSTTADFFNPLCRHIEETVLGRPLPYPPERTLLTSGMTLAAVESLHQGGKLIQTPQMNVRYTVGKSSTYWRG